MFAIVPGVTAREKDARQAVVAVRRRQTDTETARGRGEAITRLGARQARSRFHITSEHHSAENRPHRRHDVLGAYVWRLRFLLEGIETCNLVARSRERTHGALPLREEDSRVEGLGLCRSRRRWQARIP